MNRKMGDKLAREIGAVKYVEYNKETVRGYKILYDEIAHTYFAKLKDELEAKQAEEDRLQKAEIEKLRLERERQEIERKKKERQEKVDAFFTFSLF